MIIKKKLPHCIESNENLFIKCIPVVNILFIIIGILRFFLFIFRLTQTNIEEQVIASNLVHETNCVISMPEFALRLQISVDDPITAQLFQIFDPVIYS